MRVQRRRSAIRKILAHTSSISLRTSPFENRITAKPMRIKSCVIVRSRVVLRAVELDDKLRIEANEVCNVVPFGSLAPKFQSSKLTVAEALPELLLDIRRTRSHHAGRAAKELSELGVRHRRQPSSGRSATTFSQAWEKVERQLPPRRRKTCPRSKIPAYTPPRRSSLRGSVSTGSFTGRAGGPRRDEFSDSF
jgi:hypothetical protein